MNAGCRLAILYLVNSQIRRKQVARIRADRGGQRYPSHFWWLVADIDDNLDLRKSLTSRMFICNIDLPYGKTELVREA